MNENVSKPAKEQEPRHIAEELTSLGESIHELGEVLDVLKNGLNPVLQDEKDATGTPKIESGNLSPLASQLRSYSGEVWHLVSFVRRINSLLDL